MRQGAFHVSAIALGVAAFVCVSPLSAALADAPTTSGAIVEPDGSASALHAATPSLAEPNPTPLWADLGGPVPPNAMASRQSATAPTQSAAAPPLNAPAPPPRLAESSPAATAPAAGAATEGQRPSHAYAHHVLRHPHYAWRNGHRYYRHEGNPVVAVARGVVGGVADVGAIAAYPIYCFPDYGSCRVRRPYP